MVLRFAIAVALSLSLWAEKKPVTIDAVVSSRSPEASAGTPIWAANGKSFAYRQGSKIMLYEIGPKASRELLSLDPLTKAATEVPRRERFDWENRGVRESLIQWLPSGQELLISTGRDLFI